MALEALKERSLGSKYKVSQVMISRLKGDFMYLYAIIDFCSRYIVDRGLYNSLDASNTIEVLGAVVKRYDAPVIINSDHRCQYTSKEWHKICDGIKICMDGKEYCLNNIWIERFWGDKTRIYLS